VDLGRDAQKLDIAQDGKIGSMKTTRWERLLADVGDDTITAMPAISFQASLS